MIIWVSRIVGMSIPGLFEYTFPEADGLSSLKYFEVYLIELYTIYQVLLPVESYQSCVPSSLSIPNPASPQHTKEQIGEERVVWGVANHSCRSSNTTKTKTSVCAT